MDNYVRRTSQEDRREEIDKSIEFFVNKITEKIAPNRTAGYVQMLSKFISQFTEKCIARDLVAFSKHAGRSKITDDDAVLISRKTKYYGKMQEMNARTNPAPKRRANRELI